MESFKIESVSVRCEYILDDIMLEDILGSLFLEVILLITFSK